MPIFQPAPTYSSEDKELLRLLGQLLLDASGSFPSHNLRRGETPLSDSEAADLVYLLEQFAASRKFLEGSYFLETLTRAGVEHDKELREIYLSWRSRLGKSRALATSQWEDFLERLSISHGRPIDRGVRYRSQVRPMDLHHFVKMESKLATAVGLHPRVKALILNFVSARLTVIEKIRTGRGQLERGQIQTATMSIISGMGRNNLKQVEVTPMSTAKIAGVMTIVMDFGALFTTRDWSVAGFLSGIAGAFPLAVDQ